MPSFSGLLRNPLFLVSLSALLTLLLSASVFQRQQATQLQQHYDNYGNALARLAASQATDATLNHDLVSLQLTVRDVASNPQVLSTTIHDVENQLLVQAGSSTTARAMLDLQVPSYTAPITFQDSIAGQVTVTLDSPVQNAQQDNAWMIGLIAVCATLLVLSLLNRRKPDSDAQQLTEDDSDSPAAPPRATAAPFSLPGGESSALIALQFCCLNSARLKQQLSSALLDKLTDQVERCLSGVNTIYSGRITSASVDNIELQFQGDDRDNTVFRAACAAELFFRLQSRNSEGVRLQYAAAVFPVQRSTSLQRQLEFAGLKSNCVEFLQKLPANSLLLHADECASAALLQRLQLADGNPDAPASAWLQVSDLQPTYAALLEKQAQQLTGLVQAAASR